jgi:ribosome recycling factor
MNEYITKHQEDFDKTIEHFQSELNNLRVGRANPGTIENVLVDSYGVKTPLLQVSSIAVPDARSMTVEPWDKNLLKDIERALTVADLGYSISVESTLVRVTVPQMTEETRKEIVKSLSEKIESSKVALRGVREKVKEEITEAQKNKELTEDDKFDFIKELDEKTQELTKKLQEMGDGKENEIMSV